MDAPLIIRICIMAYVINRGFGFKAKGLDADAVGREMEALAREGPLTANTVVEQARDEASAMHSAFEWDDTLAAHEHRLSQARSLIRAVFITDARTEPTPVYYRVIENDEASYKPTSVVVRSQSLLDSARKQLQAELESAQRSLAQLEQAAERARDTKNAAKAARIRKPLERAVQAARE